MEEDYECPDGTHYDNDLKQCVPNEEADEDGEAKLKRVMIMEVVNSDYAWERGIKRRI